MPRLLFNRRLIQAIVAVAHLLIIILVAVFALNFDLPILSRVLAISAIQTNYEVLGVEFIGWARNIGYTITFICSVLIGYGLISYGLSRKHEVATFYSVALGIQMLLAAATNLTLIGLVWAGGIWHLISMFLIVIEAASMVVTSAIMLLYWAAYTAYGERQDQLISEVEDKLTAAELAETEKAAPAA